MTVNEFILLLKQQPESVTFQQTMAVIDANYQYQPADFTNGDVLNKTGTNEGSCKIFAFANLKQLTEQQTLACFGDYYRKDVLENPAGTDHANIRNFMKTGWRGVAFSTMPLQLKD